MTTQKENKTSRIYTEPVNDIISEIDKTSSDILLLGKEGTGKSTVINEYVALSSPYNLIINGTAEQDEMISLADPEINNVYYCVLLVQKMLKKVKEVCPKESSKFFSLEENTNRILRNIYNMRRFGNYTSKYNNIGKTLCSEPEILIDEFLEIATKYVGVDYPTVILDNFDTIGAGSVPSVHYQQYMYKLLQNSVRFVLTISDSRALNDKERLDTLNQNHTLVEMNYSTKVYDVKHIIDSTFSTGIYKNERIGLLLSDETILLMIEKTDGNLFDIIKAVRIFYRSLNTLTKEEYNAFILNYIDNVINKSPIITGNLRRERRLFI